MSLAVAIDKVRQYRADPALFATEILHQQLDDPWEREFYRSLVTEQRIAMQACKGPGKTAKLAGACWWLLSMWPYPKINAISITADNLATGLWAEMARWQRESPFLLANFTWTASKIFKNADAKAPNAPAEWWMAARSWSRSENKEQQEKALAGLHSDYCACVIDESGGMPSSILSGAVGVLTAPKMGRILQAGNPLQLEGPLYDAATRERSLWKRIEITADPKAKDRASRVPIKWAQEQIDTYGDDNPWVLANVYGRFPKSAINALISLEECQAAVGRHIPARAYDWAPRILGGDPARFGDDLCVLYPRQGKAYGKPLTMAKMDSVQVAGHWGEKFNQWQAHSLQVDSTGGYGNGPIDILRDQGYPVVEVNFSAAALDPKFFNLRSEIWWKLAESIKDGASITDDPKLIAELSTATYSYQKEKIRVEEKDQMKARLGRSPDHADAAACTHAYPVALPPDTRRALFEFDMHANYNKTLTDYDPLERA
jgi:phage terminase large subunit